MITKVIVVFVLLFLGLQIFNFLTKKASSINNCSDCEGQGYWLGTRGEKNPCKTCNGSGRK